MSEKDHLETEKEAAILQADEFTKTIEVDMSKIDERIDTTRMKQQSYKALQVHINSIRSADKQLLVNIGNGIHVKADIKKREMLLVGIGLGFYLESSLEEAQEISRLQINRLEHEIQVDLFELAKRKASLALTSQGREILQQTTID
ncbi:hypothetical protein EIN_056340 [Entamoeba invadens IP1]|uniref:hypothetical protein n=1 Tax=Entamoeba invadens IP1 TaxID=370355 RepID=UPI0002C3F295|nr:hypothetical protein EIN_056340 [Entamoeba invadens IP1]ELP93259.1 hypothetical protein EIN_056340 [Entamoeba invadens IP1]|eukprot:XP_004260030.1 hypothetical protein EIN_056340 [Entamoeba invadens IP1]